MNKVILIARLVRDPEVRYSQGENASAVARFTLAVDRKYKIDGEQRADFPNCVCFGKQAEFCEKYLRQGTKIAIVGRIQTGSYIDKNGNKIYTTDIVVDEIEFAESKASQGNTSEQQPKPSPYGPADKDVFMNIPDGIDEELPFN